MANSATEQTALPVRVHGIGPVTPVVVSIDTINTDLTVYTPASGNMACVVGLVCSETNATNLTIKSGSTSNVVLELAANQGVYDQLGDGILFITQPGEALVIQASAAISSMLFYIAENKYLVLEG